MVSTVCSPYVHIPYNNSQIPTCSILDRQSFDKIHGQHCYGGGVCYMDIFAVTLTFSPNNNDNRVEPGEPILCTSQHIHYLLPYVTPFHPPTATHPAERKLVIYLMRP